MIMIVLAKMYNRVQPNPDPHNYIYDPWVSIRDHTAGGGNQMMYGDSSSPDHNQLLRAEGGMEVFIRN